MRVHVHVPHISLPCASPLVCTYSIFVHTTKTSTSIVARLTYRIRDMYIYMPIMSVTQFLVSPYKKYTAIDVNETVKLTALSGRL